MFKENMNNKVFTKFSGVESDLKLQDIPKFNRYSNDVKRDIGIITMMLMAFAVLCLRGYYVHFNPKTGRPLGGYTLNMFVKALAAAVEGIIVAWGILRIDIRIRKEEKIPRKEIKRQRTKYIEGISKQIISYREAVLGWMNEKFVPAENLIARIMRGEKKIRNQGDVMLTYRLGTGDLDISEHIILPNMVNTPQNIKLKRTCKKLKEEYKVIHDIPKAISLDEVGLLGVVGQGDKRKAYDIVRALSTQILVSEVPEDLKVAFVYDSVHSKGWNKYESFTRTQMETGISLVAGTPEKRGKVLDMLAQTIEERKALNGDCVENMKPRYIVFIDDMALLENHRIAEALRDDLCVCAFTFIFVADCIEKLPENVEYALVDSSEFSGVYSMADHICMPMVFDKLSEQKLDKYINYIKSKKTLRGGDLCWKK